MEQACENFKLDVAQINNLYVYVYIYGRSRKTLMR